MEKTFASAPAIEAVSAAMKSIAENRTWFIVLGVLLVILGIVAIVFPFATTIAAKTVIGWLFLIGGVGQIIHAFSTQRWSQFFLSLLVGVLYLVIGGWLVFLPLSGILPLTLIIAATFIVQGGIESVMSFRMRPHDGWGWMLISGLLAVGAGLLILAQLPSSATWAIGLLVGINLISSGWAYLFLALAAGKVARSAA